MIIRKAMLEFKLEYAIDLDDSGMVERGSHLIEQELEQIIADGNIGDYIKINEEVDITEGQVKSTYTHLNIAGL
jgi:hypothetical protein